MKTNAALRNGNLAWPTTTDSMENGCSVYFATAVERDAFLALFPKWVKVRSCNLRSSYRMEGNYGLVWHQDGPNYSITYSASFSVSRLNEVTGAANETGTKRWNRFLVGVATLNIVENLV